MNRKRKNKTFKIVVLWMMILSAIWLPCGCIRKKPEITGEKSAAFQLMSEREIPEELKEWMEQEKAHPFMLTYAVEQDIYAARSYGPQNKTGYQIKVDAILEGEKTVRIQTSLLGPEKGEKTKSGDRDAERYLAVFTYSAASLPAMRPEFHAKPRARP